MRHPLVAGLGGILALLAFSISACANILNFQGFEPPPAEDASYDAMVEPDGTLVLDSGADADVTLQGPEASAPDTSLDASDASDADANDADACQTCNTGHCVDTTRDPNHCGGCNRCAGNNMVCQASQCICDPGSDARPVTHMCGGECVTDSVDHCGTGCVICALPTGASGLGCPAGVCLPACPRGTTLCSPDTPEAICTDTSQDPAHCGGCNACPAPDGGTPFCVSSTCTVACNPGLTGCPAVQPTTCVSTLSDIQNCGSCANKCPARDGGPIATCVNGVCH